VAFEPTTPPSERAYKFIFTLCGPVLRRAAPVMCTCLMAHANYCSQANRSQVSVFIEYRNTIQWLRTDVSTVVAGSDSKDSANYLWEGFPARESTVKIHHATANKLNNYGIFIMQFILELNQHCRHNWRFGRMRRLLLQGQKQRSRCHWHYGH
jgi:hypothetical protein